MEIPAGRFLRIGPCYVIETFYLQTFDIYWLFVLIFSAIAWPLQHEKWNDVDNTKISGTSLIGCCVAICRDYCRDSSRFPIDGLRLTDFDWDIQSRTISYARETSEEIIN